MQHFPPDLLLFTKILLDINATMRPAAGIMGMLAHPIEGAWKSVQKPWAKKQDSQQLATRVEAGQRAVKESTEQERRAVIETFKRMTTKNATAERRKTLDAEAKDMLQKDKSKKLTLADQEGSDGDSTSQATPRSPSPSQSNSTFEEPEPLEKPKGPPPLPPRKPSQQNQDDEDAAFQRDLEMAKQLSLAEQSGYERGLRHATG